MKETVRDSHRSSVVAPAMLLMLGAAGCGLTTMEQSVYKPSVSKAGTVRCSFMGQPFRVGDDRVEAVIGVLPEGSGGDSEYVLNVLVVAEEDVATELGPVEVGLTLAASDGPGTDRKELGLPPFRGHDEPRERVLSMGERQVMTRTWSQRFRIEPDLDPRVHKHLSLRLLVRYSDRDGESRVFEAAVPPVPARIAIPTSRV